MLIFSKSQKYAFLITYLKPDYKKFYRVEIKNLLISSEKIECIDHGINILSTDNICLKKVQEKCLVPLTSEAILELSEITLEILKVAQFVITDDNFSL